MRWKNMSTGRTHSLILNLHAYTAHPCENHVAHPSSLISIKQFSFSYSKLLLNSEYFYVISICGMKSRMVNRMGKIIIIEIDMNFI